MSSKQQILSSMQVIPSVEIALQKICPSVSMPKALLTDFLRCEIDALRSEIQNNQSSPQSQEEVIDELRKSAKSFSNQRLQPVINATGTLLHTNLGRAPQSSEVASRVAEIVTQYSNLEFDLNTGERGARAGYLEALLATLCQAEKAVAVNNCAAALVLILKSLCKEDKKEVIVSRGELIEIGGGFRIPEIMAASGATLVEIGATNKTHLSDYQQAITNKTALILKVHQSNFSMEGFVAETSLEDLAELTQKHQIPLVEDLGSGAIIHTDQLAPIEHEPTPTERLKQGADVVCFSGDKLLGGPQSGIIAGKAELLQKIKKEPFFRAVRCDKLILATLQETVSQYLLMREERQDSTKSATPVPALERLAISESEMAQQTEEFYSKLQALVPESVAEIALEDSFSQVGGGTMPSAQVPTKIIQISPKGLKTAYLAKLLRKNDIPIIATINDDQLCLNLRTVLPDQEEELFTSLSKILNI